MVNKEDIDQICDVIGVLAIRVRDIEREIVKIKKERDTHTP